MVPGLSDYTITLYTITILDDKLLEISDDLIARPGLRCEDVALTDSQSSIAGDCCHLETVRWGGGKGCGL